MKKNIILLRTIEILLVVIGHITYVFTGNWVYSMPENPSIIIFLCKYIYTFHMPVFISISGYLFHYTIVENNSDVAITKYTNRKMKRLLLPLCFVLMVWVVPIKIFTGYYSLLGYNNIQDILMFIIKELDVGHLWYLLALFILDILMVSTYKTLEEKILRYKVKKYTFILILAFLSVFYYVSDRYFSYIIGKVLKLAFFYMMGYFIRKYENKGVNIYKLKLFSVMLIVHLFGIIFKAYISSRLILTDYFTEFLVFLLNFIVGFTATYILYNIVFTLQALSELTIVKYINKKSMDIYLFHEPIIYIVIYIFNYYHISSPYLFLVVAGCVSIGISISIAGLIRKLNLGVLIGDKR